MNLKSPLPCTEFLGFKRVLKMDKISALNMCMLHALELCREAYIKTLFDSIWLTLAIKIHSSLGYRENYSTNFTRHNCIKPHICFKGVLHLLPKITMFCALSQNNQHLLENNIIMHLMENCSRDSKISVGQAVFKL